MSNVYDVLGKEIPIQDAALKVTGQMKYVADVKTSGVLHAKMLTSPVAHAKIKHIDISKAEALPGVRAVATHVNAASTLYNSATRFYEHQIPNTEQIFSPVVRFVGDRVAAVAADSLAIAKKAISLIEVEYEALPFYLDVEAAVEEGAFPLHGESNQITRIEHNAGDVNAGMADADEIFEGRYETQPVHHGAIEPHVAIADYDARGKLTVTSPNQNTFAFRLILQRIFGFPMSKIQVKSPIIGGAFGGKLEMTIEPVVAQLAIMAKKPVRLELTRKECIECTRTRHASVTYIKTGVKKDGTVVAQDIKVLTNTGAYASSALNVLGALSHKVFKLYKCPNIRFVGIPIYTNTPIAGAMRGYGSPQAFFAQQCQYQAIADALGMPIAEFQRQNLVQPTALDPIGGYSLGNPRPLDCLAKAEELMKNWPKVEEDDTYTYGIGLAAGLHGNGCFGAHRDQICLMAKCNEDGSVVLYTGSHDMGNGSITAQSAVLSEILKIPLDRISYVTGDTDVCPWNLGDYSSHGIFVACGAAKKLAESIKAELLKEASLLLEKPAEELTLGWNGISCAEKTVALSEIMMHAQAKSGREIICSETYVMPGGPGSYGVHAARVQLHKESGDIRVTDYVAVHDVGNVINRLSIEGQLEGGVQMGIGYALSEGLSFDEKGRNVNSTLRKYKMLRASDMPNLQIDFIEKGEPLGPFGAKSIGECAVVPSAPAVTNAVSMALGKPICKLPYRI